MDEGQQTSSNINKLLIWDHPKSPHWTTRSGLQRIVLHDAYEAKNTQWYHNMSLGFDSVGTGFWIISLSVELGSRFQSLGGFWIPWAVFHISKSRISQQKFGGYQIPQVKISQIFLESGFPYMGQNWPWDMHRSIQHFNMHWSPWLPLHKVLHKCELFVGQACSNSPLHKANIEVKCSSIKPTSLKNLV